MIDNKVEASAVGLGEVIVSNQDGAVLVAYGLGSCVAVCLYDPEQSIGGMAHVVLPASGDSAKVSAKYADIAVPFLRKEMLRLGARRGRLMAKIAGGARVLNAWAGEDRFNIGERNTQAAREALAKETIPILGADTGGTKGRTVRFEIGTGRVTVQIAGSPEKEL